MKNNAELPITDQIIARLDGMSIEQVRLTLESAIEELFRLSVASVNGLQELVGATRRIRTDDLLITNGAGGETHWHAARR